MVAGVIPSTRELVDAAGLRSAHISCSREQVAAVTRKFGAILSVIDVVGGSSLFKA
jgi:hypothetical protein